MDAQALRSNQISIPASSTEKNTPSQNPDVVSLLLQVLNLKDQQTRIHLNRVHELTREWMAYMTRHSELEGTTAALVELSALLHDVGKIGVLDEVLTKPEMLTPHERNHMEQHSELGYQMIRDYPGMSEVAEAIRHHHERWDGGGYPLGLREKQIPVASRMIAIVDTYDAIVSERPYKTARPVSDAMNEIKKEAGRQFCPTLASQFIQFMQARNS